MKDLGIYREDIFSMGHLEISEMIIIFILIPFVFLYATLQVLAFWKIFTRIGMNGALSLLFLIPFGKIILPLYIAFAKWPVLEQKSKETP